MRSPLRRWTPATNCFPGSSTRPLGDCSTTWVSRACERPAHRRLAFRELGLAIGLAAVPTIRAALEGPGLTASDALAELSRCTALGEEIEAFWLRPEHRECSTWREHLDIDDVMLATSLTPEGFLTNQAAPSPT
jgi:hypothetical protein